MKTFIYVISILIPYMVIVDVDEDVYKFAKRIVLKNKVDYPSIKNYIDKAIREKNKIELIQEKENA